MHQHPLTITLCPLCADETLRLFHQDKSRIYFRCQNCQLIFVPPPQHLDRNEELSEYQLHQNDPNDPGYRRFLSRLATPLQQHLSPASRGLDFGSGPGPTLSLMLSEHGHQVSLYDPFFAADTNVLTSSYDFITATEVVEHLRQPRLELDRLWSLLNPGGWFGIMTKLALDAEAFSRWHYKNDRTHIIFFSRDTFTWLARHWDAHLHFVDKDVILLQKPA